MTPERPAGSGGKRRRRSRTSSSFAGSTWATATGTPIPSDPVGTSTMHQVARSGTARRASAFNVCS